MGTVALQVHHDALPTDRLRLLIEHLKSPPRAQRESPVSWGFPAIDAALPHAGLSRSAVHELIPTDDQPPPLCILMHLARRATHGVERGLTVWVGPRVWAYPPALAAAGLALSASVFVDAIRPQDRLWAMDLALRSASCAAVVGDGADLDLASTRRLQLAAEAGGTPCLLARPSREARALSAATTRWRTAPAPVFEKHAHTRRWTVELLRCKGMQPIGEPAPRWLVELDHATNARLVVPDALDRPAHAPPQPARSAG